MESYPMEKRRVADSLNRRTLLRSAAGFIKRTPLLMLSGTGAGVSTAFVTAFVADKQGGLFGGKLPAQALAGFSFEVEDPEKCATLHCYKAEMGQGVQTLFAMLIAEELNTPLEKFAVDLASNPTEVGNPATVGSDSARSLWKPMRRLGAVIHRLLKEAAAEQWHCSPEQIAVESGQVYDRTSNRQSAWSELQPTVETRLLQHYSAGEAIRPGELKEPSAFTLLGKPQTPVNIEAILTGQQNYTYDLTPSSTNNNSNNNSNTVMLIRPPTPWHRRLSDNRQSLLSDQDTHPGLINILTLSNSKLPHGKGAIALFGRDSWSCIKAKRALSVEWKHSRQGEAFADMAAYRAHLLNVVERAAERKGRAQSAGYKRVTATYSLPFVAHQSLEPPCCVVTLQNRHSNQDVSQHAHLHCQIWIPTQRADKVRSTAASFLKVAEEAIDIYPQRLGGAFGRKAYTDYLLELLVAAKALQSADNSYASLPSLSLKLFWDREDDMCYDYYRAAAVEHINADLGEGGKIEAWHHFVAEAGERRLYGEAEPIQKKNFRRGLDPLLYKVDDYQVEGVSLPSELNTGIWRSIDYSTHIFAVESFVERLAFSAGQHPLLYRIAQLRSSSSGGFSPQRMLALLEKMKKMEKMEKMEKKGRVDGMDNGVAVGYAALFAFQTYVLLAIEVERQEKVEKASAGHLALPIMNGRIIRVNAIVDAGFIVNPDAAQAQVEGAILFGLSAAVYGGVDTRLGAVVADNFNKTPVVRMNQSPEMKIHFIKSGEAPSGLGEPVVPAVAPALCNALSRLTGRPIYNLPLVD